MNVGNVNYFKLTGARGHYFSDEFKYHLVVVMFCENDWKQGRLKHVTLNI